MMSDHRATCLSWPDLLATDRRGRKSAGTERRVVRPVARQVRTQSEIAANLLLSGDFARRRRASHGVAVTLGSRFNSVSTDANRQAAPP